MRGLNKLPEGLSIRFRSRFSKIWANEFTVQNNKKPHIWLLWTHR